MRRGNGGWLVRWLVSNKPPLRGSNRCRETAGWWHHIDMQSDLRRLGWSSWELRIPIKEPGSSERPRMLVREYVGSKKEARDELDRLQRGLETLKVNGKPASTYRAYSLDFFEDWNWSKVHTFLTGNGGCFGVAGPRGIGKTWLLRRASEWAGDQGGIGIYFPAPSAYDPSSFIVAITDAFGAALERNLRPTWGSRTLDFLLRKPSFYLPVFLLIFGFGFYFLGDPVHRLRVIVLSYILAVLIAFFATYVAYRYILFVLHQILLGRSVELRLKDAGSAARQRLRYALQAKESREFGITAGKGIMGSLKEAQEKSFVERPITLASLVYDFRDIAALTARLLGRPVVVAVDELDKIDSLDEMRSLLRDIKGVFDIPGVSFLVSISDEALRSVHAGAFVGRDEFSSSFYGVAVVAPLNAQQAKILIHDRTGKDSPKCATGLMALTCGNPREIVRLTGGIEAGTLERDDLRSAMRQALRIDAMEIMERIIRSALQDDVKSRVAGRIQHGWLEISDSQLPTYSDSDSLWISDPYDDPENHELCEFWNRFLVRTWVAAALGNVTDNNRLEKLSPTAIECVRYASWSADWARSVGETNLLFP